MSADGMMDAGLTGIVLPTGQILGVDDIRNFNFNQHVNALRLSFETDVHRPVGVDSISGWVRGLESSRGRVAVIAHKFFRFRDTLYIVDADIKVLLGR